MTFQSGILQSRDFVTELVALNNPLTGHGIQEKSSSHVTYSVPKYSTE